MNILQLLRKNNPLPEMITADSLARQARMSEKLAQIKSDMGEKWILHPCHKVTKLDKPRGF